jgi:prepilin-type N-terminal cleavage/methylation domain-containing protein
VKRSLPGNARFSSRRGVTLVEMLVTLAVLLIIMTVIVQIFQAATGSLSSAQAYQELDNQLRRLDATIRSDLTGVTARTTPPLDPRNNQGYIELGENEFADMQGEDSDDYIRFTAKAPPDQPFVGRMYAPPVMINGTPATVFNANFQPITVTSEYAEIIYFLRNGNLYRRVLLVAPDRQSSIVPTINNLAVIVAGGGPLPPINYQPLSLGGFTVSWQGVNDLSARPAITGAFHHNSVILNTLGDLTNRENRFAAPRFSNDYQDLSGAIANGGDGLADDLNGDNVPDYYNSLYPGAFANAWGAAGQLVFEPNNGIYTPRPALGMLAFPYIFPAAYSRPQALATDQYGWIHSPNPEVSIGGGPVRFDQQPLVYLQNINHNPLDTGDNLPLPPNQVQYEQTWWGFPTWREMLSPLWSDPTRQVNGVNTINPNFNFAASQPVGLNPLTPGNGGEVQTGVVDNTGTIRSLLPAMTSAWRTTPQPFTDGFGANNVFFSVSATGVPPLWNPYSWEDDLIMTNVRSFDIKVYDNALSGYADLGWGDDPRLTAQLAPPFLGFAPALGVQQQIPYLAGNLDFVSGNYQTPAYANINFGLYDLVNQTFAHEGRMPPLVSDVRFDAQYGAAVSYLPSNSPFLPANGGFYTGNIGDNSNGVVRLRRVWDSWSTDYSKAPGIGVAPGTATAPFTPNFPAGPPYTPPVYPSYPPPYPAPLRGVQIQVRVVDPTNQRIKTLTIRQDFSDKL